MADEGTGDKILSQSEVDALLGAVNQGDVKTESKIGAGSNLDKYDFSKQRKLVRARMPGLKIVYDRFQRSYRQTLSSLVRKVVVVEVLQTEMMRYSEWIATLPVPSCLNIVRLSPLIGQSIISLEIPYVYTLIDNIFGGGKFGQNRQKEGDFTSIELKMIQKLIHYFTNDLEKAWSTLYELNYEFVRTDMNPEYVSIVAPSDIVVVTDFGVSFEETTTRMQMVVPLFALDPIKQLLSDHTFVEQSQPNPNWKIWLSQSINGSKINSNVLLGKTEITMGEVLGLKLGDTIQLDQYVSNPLTMSVETVPKYAVRMGTSCGQKAVQVEQVFDRKSNSEDDEE
ncbi:MAG: flagellar motor switch protein FliM [Deltaproteobacteria bacterium]|nr:flagellar motor switch protein FliM [Deltaproteobacteria bacterium]